MGEREQVEWQEVPRGFVTIWRGIAMAARGDSLGFRWSAVTYADGTHGGPADSLDDAKAKAEAKARALADAGKGKR